MLKKFSGYGQGGCEVWVQRSSHGQHNLFIEHVHDFIELVYIVQGQGTHRINGTNYPLQTGDVFVIMPGESHHFPDVKDYNLEIVNCLFRRDMVPAHLPPGQEAWAELPYIRPFYRSSEAPPRKLSLTSSESTEVLNRLEEMLLELKACAVGANVIVAQLLVHLLIRLSRVSLHQAPEISATVSLPVNHEILVRRVNDYLEKHFHQKLSIEELARVFAISTRHLSRVFRQQTHKSISESLQQIRIERAKQMLAETNRTVESISSFVGFNDSSHFNRSFTKFTGCSPGRYRRESQKKLIL